jgi:ABC-type multidrug transport system fused ATPase/permease subunit
VSERIGADLRTATFEHLMKQSLEYFGGKRTGDLMARIGSPKPTASMSSCRCICSISRPTC